MVCGMGVEVAGTEHVATARFDVASGHIKIGFGRLLLRGRRQIKETGAKGNERKPEESRQTRHDSSNGMDSLGMGPDLEYGNLLFGFGGFN
jgi:hypothetical protein